MKKKNNEKVSCQERIKEESLINIYGAFPRVSTLKLFIDMVMSPSLHNLTTCVEQIFSWSIRLSVKRSGK